MDTVCSRFRAPLECAKSLKYVLACQKYIYVLEVSLHAYFSHPGVSRLRPRARPASLNSKLYSHARIRTPLFSRSLRIWPIAMLWRYIVVSGMIKNVGVFYIYITHIYIYMCYKFVLYLSRSTKPSPWRPKSSFWKNTWPVNYLLVLIADKDKKKARLWKKKQTSRIACVYVATRYIPTYISWSK